MTDRDNTLQTQALVRYGVHPDDIYQDAASGRSMVRRGWDACLRRLGKGDLLVVYSLDRLGRDIPEIVHTVNHAHASGADLITLDGIDSRTTSGAFLFSVVAKMATWERELAIERGRIAGLSVARERGKLGGARPKNLEADYIAARRRIDRGEDGFSVAAGLPTPMSRSGLYRAFERLRREGKLT